MTIRRRHLEPSHTERARKRTLVEPNRVLARAYRMKGIGHAFRLKRGYIRTARLYTIFLRFFITGPSDIYARSWKHSDSTVRMECFAGTFRNNASAGKTTESGLSALVPATATWKLSWPQIYVLSDIPIS